MKKKMINTGKFREYGIMIILIYLFSYLLNFVWESFHSVFLYEGHNFNAIRYVPMIGYVSNIDSLLILGVFVIISIIWKDLFWIKSMNSKQVFAFITISLVTAAIIEYRALFILHKWSYKALMPTIAGIGLSPVLQLSITGLIALWVTKNLLCQKRNL